MWNSDRTTASPTSMYRCSRLWLRKWRTGTRIRRLRIPAKNGRERTYIINVRCQVRCPRTYLSTYPRYRRIVQRFLVTSGDGRRWWRRTWSRRRVLHRVFCRRTAYLKAGTNVKSSYSLPFCYYGTTVCRSNETKYKKTKCPPHGSAIWENSKRHLDGFGTRYRMTAAAVRK